MENFKFNKRYNVFRYSYWGECAGSKRVSSKKTSYLILIKVFGSIHQEGINLLINNGTIYIIENIKNKISHITNDNFEFWDTHIC
jgi:hypothetical protein